MQGEYAKNLAVLRAAFPLPALVGTWDVYPYSQNIPLANAVPWSPRPIFQSYSAYGPALAELNAAHLVGAIAPDNILFGISPIDGRMGALEDGISWPTLINNYSLRGRLGDFLILRKNNLSKGVSLERFKSIDKNVGESIPVPHKNGPVWVKLDLTPSLLGRIANILFATPEVRIELTFADGKSESYRYIASMGKAGFMVSPLVRNTDDFAKLMSADLSRNVVGSDPVYIRILPQRKSDLLWSRHVHIEFLKLPLVDPAPG
jgi:hypothetical protein